MQPENTRIFSTKPSLNLRGELMGATRPQKADSGSLFTEEFERATRLESSTDAEMRHDTRHQERATQEARTGRQESADLARGKAQSSRSEADATRGERSTKRADRRERTPMEPSQAANPLGMDRPRNERRLEIGTDRVQGSRDGAEAQAKELDTGRPSREAAKSGVAPPVSNAQVNPTKVGGANQSPSSSNSVGAPTGIRAGATPAPAASNQAGNGEQSQSGNRQSAKAVPGGDRPVDAPEARDAMEKLLVERENRMDREASILRQVKASMKPGGRELSVRLSPASLGQVDLNLAVREGRLTATIRTETTEAYEAIEHQLPELQAALESQGIEVMGFDLELASDSESSGTFRDHNSQGNTLTPPAGNQSLGSRIAAETSANVAREIRAVRSALATNRGGVDTVG